MNHSITGHEQLHSHSMFSLLDGYQTPLEACQRIKQNGGRFCCLTDHGAMGGIPQQIAGCEKHGLSPIFGIEFYYNPQEPGIRSPEERKKYMAELDDVQKKKINKNYHLLAIAYNEQGYSNLVRLSSWGYIHGYGGRPTRPRINKEMLLAHKEGITFTSCCYASEIGFTFDTLGEDAAMDKVAEYIEMFGANFRLEIMMLDFVKQKPYDIFILKAHAKFGIPVIITGDCHYAEPEDSYMQRLMLMIQTGKTIREIEKLQYEGADLFELQDEQLWMKSEDELNSFWENKYSDVIDYELFKQAKRETVKLAEFSKGVELDRSNKLPQIPDADEILKEKAKDGFLSRNCPKKLVYIDRLKEELDLICRKGFSSYFLIQKQMTDEARRMSPILMGWGDGSEAVGPGRGCLAPYVMIRVVDQSRVKETLKPISEVKVGELVIAHDGSIRKVTNVFQYENQDELLRFCSYFGDKNGVVLTKDHKVLASRKTVANPKDLRWIQAGDLDVGDWVYNPSHPKGITPLPVPNVLPKKDDQDIHLRTKSGGTMTRIRTIGVVTDVPIVHDLEVEESHSFLTTSFIVHNSAVGALTCYCLGITDVDPIKHDLLFSRFLSEARGGKTMKIRFTNIDPIAQTGYSGYSINDGQTWQDGI